MILIVLMKKYWCRNVREKKKNSRPQPKKYYEIYDNKNILTVSGLYVATHAFEATTKITGLLICHKLLVSWQCKMKTQYACTIDKCQI